MGVSSSSFQRKFVTPDTDPGLESRGTGWACCFWTGAAGDEAIPGSGKDYFALLAMTWDTKFVGSLLVV